MRLAHRRQFSTIPRLVYRRLEIELGCLVQHVEQCFIFVFVCVVFFFFSSLFVSSQTSQSCHHGRRHHWQLYCVSSGQARVGPRHCAAGAEPNHVGDDLARGRADGALRLLVRDVDRVAQVHAPALRLARARDGPRHRLQPGGVHGHCHRQGPPVRVSQNRRLQPQVRRPGRGNLCQRGALVVFWFVSFLPSLSLSGVR